MAETLIFEMEINAKMDKALEEVKEINEGTKEINENLSAIKQSSKVAETGIKGISKGFKGLGLAMKTAGIGLIIEAFNFLRDIMMKNQRIVDGLSIVFDSISIVFNQVSSTVVDLGESMFSAFSNPKQAVTDLWNAIKTNIVNRIEGLIDTFRAVGSVIKSALDLDFAGMREGAKQAKTGLIQMTTGLDEVQQSKAWDTLKNGAETILKTGANAVKTATELTELRNSVKLLEAEQEKLNFTYLKEQELQRQTRDNTTLTFQERIEANQKLGASLNKQLEDEKRIVEEKLRLAKMESDANAENVDLKAEVIRAEAELADLEERITGQKSEMLTNEVALLEEQKQAREELRLASLTEQEKELEDLKLQYEAKLELARKAGVDSVAITEQYEAERTYILGEEDRKRAEEKRKQDEADAKAKEKADADDLKRTEAIEQLKTDMKAKALTMTKGLFAENEKAQKAFALAEIGIDTARAISSLTANAEANPANAVTFGGAGVLQFVTGMLRIATNIKSAKKLLSSKNPNPDTNTDSGGGGDDGSQSQRPSMVSNTPTGTEFDLSASTQQFQQQPIQAFVVQTDIQNQQENLNQIQEQATL